MASPAFQFYPGDFVTGTIHMSAEEVGGYMLLLCCQWEQGSAPASDAELRRIARCSARALATIKAKFVAGGDGRLRNERLERVRGELASFCQSQRERATKGWKHRKNHAGAMPGHPSGITPASAGQCPNDALQSSVFSLQEETPLSPPPSGGKRTRQKFERPTKSQIESLYVAYPRRVGKESAVKAIAKAIDRVAGTRDDPLAFLLDRVMAYAASPAGQPPSHGDDFRPHPATWFNQGRYDDDPSTWQKRNGSSQHSGSPSGPGRVNAAPGKYDGLGVVVDVERHQQAARCSTEESPAD